jgi:hypothetical protein
MSVVSIGTSNINMGNQGGLGGTSQLSNLWGGTSSVSLNNIWTAKVYARKSGQSNFGYFSNKKFRCIRLTSNDYGKGTVSFTYPVTVNGGSGSVGDNYAWDYSVYSYVTVTANQTYPYVFQYWVTVSPSSGTILSYSSSVNLYATDWTSNYIVQAFFA